MLYVLDTSVLLSDPHALSKLADRDIVIPLAVLNELEAKRAHPDLGFPARSSLRYLESLRAEFGQLTETISTPQGGSIRVEINNISDSSIPETIRDNGNDGRILAVAVNLSKEEDVTLLTKDLPMRLKASVCKIESGDYDENSIDVDWPGVFEVYCTSALIDEVYELGKISQSDLGISYPVNTGLILKSDQSSALCIVEEDGKVRRAENIAPFELRGKSAEQRLAMDLLGDSSVGIVSLAGKAGTGKTTLALAAGLEEVLEKSSMDKITVFRPLYAVGGQEIGFLPGTAEEKMEPWARAIFDCLEGFCSKNVIDEVIRRDMIEVLPLTHIRGRTLTNSFVIIEEAQNLDSMVLLTALSRIGENSKVVMTHDVAQRDNLRVGRHDGISAVVSKLVGNKLFAHITMQKSERSEIAELVSELLDD